MARYIAGNYIIDGLWGWAVMWLASYVVGWLFCWLTGWLALSVAAVHIGGRLGTDIYVIWLLIKYLGNRLFGSDCLGGWVAMGPFFFPNKYKDLSGG